MADKYTALEALTCLSKKDPLPETHLDLREAVSSRNLRKRILYEEARPIQWKTA